jgi:hypothetical protein
MSKLRSRISINVNPAGYGTVEIDGQRIRHLKGFDVKARAGELTEVTLHAEAWSVDMDCGGFVSLRPEIQESLIALGWTPPKPD